jgi:two-component system sensor histidine kinase QseC
VKVAMSAAGHGVLVTVEDTGSGVTDEDLTRLGQRFYRASDARAGGSGLGLSIVSRIVTLHHGTVLFTRGVQGHGFRVELRLPASG